MTATGDGVFVFTQPDGRRIAECGTPSRVSAAVADSFRGDIAAVDAVLRTFDAELEIDSGTSRCRWLGETMDYSQAIEGLQFLRDRAAVPAESGP